MRKRLSALARYIITPRVSKYRLFCWEDPKTLPDSATCVFAREDDYFFGVLHSRAHEIWARAQGTQLREVESGFRYTPKSVFQTFPAPWRPGSEPKDSSLLESIAESARELVAMRDTWLNPTGASAEELKARTLTNLYNSRPQWLADAHHKLDAAVFAAYGWPTPSSDAEVLERLLQLNHERAV